MQQIAEKVRRAFKTVAGLDPSEPLTSPIVALYALLFLVAMSLLLVWLLGVASD
ncbi:MAG TPA: hypothetical protein VHZ75_10085 [Solirubrobacteraceae bacterium]|jgi:hypothetical protein|nr:hypothetical protein [Solirubrobacteraceae bacterium]